MTNAKPARRKELGGDNGKFKFNFNGNGNGNCNCTGDGNCLELLQHRTDRSEGIRVSKWPTTLPAVGKHRSFTGQRRCKDSE